MKKQEFIKRYGEDAYEEYKKKQKALTKRWRGNNREKSRKYALDYYYSRGQANHKTRNRISAVYQIINDVTGDRYVGSSKDVKQRWSTHRCPSTWNKCPNYPLYRDMQKYGIENFRFQILAPVEPEYLTQVEQEFIDMLHPTYNNRYAKGINVERQKRNRKGYENEKD